MDHHADHNTDSSNFTPSDIEPIPAATREDWLQRRGMMWRGAKEAYWWMPGDAACGHEHRRGLRFDLDFGLKEGRDRVFPAQERGCRCWSIPIYEENGVRVGKDRFERNIWLLTIGTGAIICAAVFFF